MEISKPEGRVVDQFGCRSQRARSTVPVLQEFGIEEEDLPLPEWLLEEILIRLPLDSVFRFRCVSKEWLLQLSDPFFRRRFLSHRASSNPSWTLLYGYTRVAEDISDSTSLNRCPIGDSPVVSGFTVLPSHSSLGTLQFLGSSNGLLLCCQSWKDLCYIYNPFTLQCLVLPRGMSWVEPTREGLITKVEGGELKGYKVVRVGQELETPEELFVDVFCSELGSWTNYKFYSSHPDQFPKPFPYFQFARAVTVNETVYLPDYQEGVLVAYNPYTSPDQVTIVKLPERELDRLPTWFQLCDAFREKLRYYTVSDAWENPTLKVWELTESSNGGEWSLVHGCRWSEIESEDARLRVHPSYRSFLPLSFHPSNPDIVYLWSTKCIASYDMKARRLEVFCELDSSFRGLSWESVMPLVLPDWPVSIPPASWKMDDS